MRDVETIIIGGGPAGSSCAWALKRRRRECLIIERQDLPKFKLCAGWITPEVLRDLEFDAASYPHGIVELKRMRLYLGFSALSVSYPTRQYSIRRIEFDNWLLQRSGAEIINHQVRSITAENGHYVLDGEFRCRYLVGAGGTHCPVKKAFFEPDRGQLIITQEIEYETKPKDFTCSLFYPVGGWAGYGWYVPKADAVNIGYGGAASQFQGRIKSLWPAFVKTLKKRGLIDTEPPEPAGYPYYVGDRKKTVRRDNAFIVGDAAGLATADLGEGIGPAVQSGLAVGREIAGEGRYAVEMIAPRTLDGAPGALMARLVAARH